MRNSARNIKDSSAYYNQCKRKIYKMVNQHGNFHIFRTESYNTSTWPIYLELIKEFKDIVDKNSCAMLPLENLFFYESVFQQKKHIFEDLFGWIRWVMKFEFQKRGYVHLHEIDFLPKS
jgi:hypothetical protein